MANLECAVAYAFISQCYRNNFASISSRSIPMPFQAQCPHCQKHATAPDGAEGKRLRCPHCQEMFAVHQGTEPARAVTEPALAATPHVAWEYYVEDIVESLIPASSDAKDPAARRKLWAQLLQGRLNVLGAEGWELVTSVYKPPESTTLADKLGFWKMIFKRPKLGT